jgi:hypothetical protein
MRCPLCGTRRARRGCPAIGEQICAVCCGTKRLIEIRCPPDCPYLASAREHPSAVTLRRQHLDLRVVASLLRDLNERQTELFSLIGTFLMRYEPSDLQALIDDDFAEAASSIAGTFETAARGIIYEQQPASLPASRLAAALKSLLAEAGVNQRAGAERDAAVVLRRFEEAVRDARTGDAANRRAFLDLLGRMLRNSGQAAPADSEPPPSRLIVP